MWKGLLTFTMIMWIDGSQTANILCLFPYQSYSHFTAFKGVLEKLSERGHNVDVVSHFPRTTPIPRYTDLSLKGTMPSLLNTFDVDKAAQGSNTHLENLKILFASAGHCKRIFSMQVIKDLRRSTKKYDLIITTVFANDCLLGFAHLFKVPVIQCSASGSLPWANDRTGTPDNPAYIPAFFTPYTSNMNIFQRTYNVFNLYQSKFAYDYYNLDVANQYVKDFFGEGTPHLRELARNVSLVLINTHFSFHESKPVPPNSIEVGGIHIGEKSKLPSDLDNFLNKSINGVIYISFGSIVNMGSISLHKLRGILETLEKVPHEVLWRGSRDELPKHLNIPNNVHMIPWSLQFEILCHPNVKLFINHAGLLGTQEAITCGKPILAIPIYGDQPMNGNIILEKGIGQTIPYTSLTKDNFARALNEMLSNSKYEENMKKMSEIFWSRPMSPMDTAIYWTEYVIRHEGALHLRPKGADMPWYTYHCIDIIVVPIIVVALFAMLIYRLLKWILSFKNGKLKIA